MKIKLYRPESPRLRKYIECVYTLERPSGEQPIRYLTFPSIFTIVTANAHSSTSVTRDSLIIKHSASKKIETNLVCNFTRPVNVEYAGAINEVTVYFKPLGLNAFLDDDLSCFRKNNYADFEPFEDYRASMMSILLEKDGNKKIRELERYWLSKLKGFRHPFLEHVVAELLKETDRSRTIERLSHQQGISRNTLTKHFARHICKSPSQFRKIVRFRTAMRTYLNLKKEGSLTDISYSLSYFDQSHMVKEFRSLTGYSPAAFFSRLTAMEKGEVNWLFL